MPAWLPVWYSTWLGRRWWVARPPCARLVPVDSVERWHSKSPGVDAFRGGWSRSPAPRWPRYRCSLMRSTSGLRGSADCRFGVVVGLGVVLGRKAIAAVLARRSLLASMQAVGKRCLAWYRGHRVVGTLALVAVLAALIVVATGPADSGGLDPSRPISNSCGEDWNPRAQVGPDGSRMANLGCSL